MPPEQITFFLDRSVGKVAIADALRALGVKVVCHDELLAPDAPDEQWLRLVGKNGWPVITCDKNIRYRRNEIAAIREFNVVAFVLTAGHSTSAQKAETVRTAFDEICNKVRAGRRPALYSVTKAGKVHAREIPHSP